MVFFRIFFANDRTTVDHFAPVAMTRARRHLVRLMVRCFTTINHIVL